MSSSPTNDSLISFARRFRQEAAAALIAVIRDDDASPSARVQAAEKILSYSDGRPGQSKPITVSDIGRLTDAERSELLHSLLLHYETTLPEGRLKDLFDQCVATAVASTAAKPAMRRGAPIPSNQSRLQRPPSPDPVAAAAMDAELQDDHEPPPAALAPKPAPPPPDNVVRIHPSVLERSRLTQDQLFPFSQPYDPLPPWRR
jgi:hypothetical protein